MALLPYAQVDGLTSAADVAEEMILSDDILAVRWKDRFDPDYDALPIGGYRDLQMLGLIEMDGRYHYVEVQINIKTMLQIKSGGRGTGGAARAAQSWAAAAAAGPAACSAMLPLGPRDQRSSVRLLQGRTTWWRRGGWGD